MTEEKQTDTDEKGPIKVSFSLPQIAGGALAAATAAAIGSQLGVAGTILGAAVASIVGGVAGTLYSAGIDRTHRKVSDAIVRGYDRVRHDPDYDPAAPHSLAADGSGPVPAEAATTVLPGLADEVFRADPDATRVDLTPVADPGPVATPARGKRVGKVMLLTVGAMFLVALAVVTVVELGLGRALGGGEGTTVSQVVQPSRPSAKPTPTPTPSATTTEPTPTPTPSATTTEPTSTPTATATTTPTSTATATDTVQPAAAGPTTPTATAP